ncbi:hypothetical protein [Listeria ilorinensis]|uniref:hypothetical protein n=1 Tax=Listeria ilorinensis TaxID=2867439 RepID=UPI001EF4DFA4|nr:hypothetical protein [Listeria ilorinensis]
MKKDYRYEINLLTGVLHDSKNRKEKCKMQDVSLMYIFTTNDLNEGGKLAEALCPFCLNITKNSYYDKELIQ